MEDNKITSQDEQDLKPTEEPREQAEESEEVREGSDISVVEREMEADKPHDEFQKARPKPYLDKKGMQIALGIISSVVIWGLLWLGGAGNRGIVSWLWVVVFGVVWLGKNRMERKMNVFFKYFTFSMLITLIVLLAVTTILFFAVPGLFAFMEE